MDYRKKWPHVFWNFVLLVPASILVWLWRFLWSIIFTWNYLFPQCLIDPRKPLKCESSSICGYQFSWIMEEHKFADSQIHSFEVFKIYINGNLLFIGNKSFCFGLSTKTTKIGTPKNNSTFTVVDLYKWHLSVQACSLNFLTRLEGGLFGPNFSELHLQVCSIWMSKVP